MTRSLLPFLLTLPLAAQAPKAPAPKAAAGKSATDPTADAARKAMLEVLDTVNGTWFGPAYQGITAVQMDGTLNLEVSGAAVNAKIDQLSQGQVKADTKGGNVSMKVKSTYFANGDYKTELNGNFGNLTAQRRGDKGFIYSKDHNAYTTRIDPAEADAPRTYLAWFRQTLNDIKAVYVDAPTFKPSVAGEETSSGRTLQRLVFNAPTSAWDPRKREQSMAESLGFWKRGRLEVAADKTTRLPYRMEFKNDEQGIQTRMDFSYDAKGKVQNITIQNQSRGMEGPGFLRVSYGAEGRISSLQGQLQGPGKKVNFDLNLAWSGNLGPQALAALPPAGATKKGREELETLLLVTLAGQIMELQRSGLNLRSVSLAGK
jgi:hypothetical protein